MCADAKDHAIGHAESRVQSSSDRRSLDADAVADASASATVPPMDANRRARALERAAESEVPGVLAGAGRERWVGMRPITPDGLPVLGRLPRTDNVYVATGHQMLGLTLAPSTGKAMAELILEGASVVDLTPFSPERFGR